MSFVFPKWTNRLPLLVVVGASLVGTAGVGGVWYYFSPKYTRVGYQPVQPVAFSHNIHVDQLGMDCRYCHSHVEKSWYSNVPASGTCINCHGPQKGNILGDSPKLQRVRESAETGRPIPWVQVHKVPDYVYFNHSVHVNRGISCVHCHGEINKMEEVYHAKPLSMTFCLDCHRNPAPNLRPIDKVTDLAWDPHQNLPANWFEKAARDWKINASQDCSVCHR
jgi:hypothetical protein